MWDSMNSFVTLHNYFLVLLVRLLVFRHKYKIHSWFTHLIRVPRAPLSESEFIVYSDIGIWFTQSKTKN